MSGWRGWSWPWSLLWVAACGGGTDPNAGGDDGSIDRCDGTQGMCILEVSRGGRGFGTVTSTPAGIDCGEVCLAEFPEDSTVTLTAVADPRWMFGGWLFCDNLGSEGGGACTVEMSHDREVLASFGPGAEVHSARRYGGELADQITHAAVDPSGNALVAGTFRGTISLGDQDLVSAGGALDVFVAKVSPDHDLELLWAGAIPGSGEERVGGLSVDADGNVYVGGTFDGTIGEDADCTSQGGTDVFHARLAAETGEVEWVRCYGGASDDQVGDLVVDAGGTLWVAHFFKGTASFEQGAARVFTSAGGDDIVLSRYSELGAHVGSVQYGGATGDDQLQALAAARDKGVFAVGSVVGDVTFGDDDLTSYGNSDAVVLRLGPEGEVVWARNWGGGGRDGADQVAAAWNGDVVMSGAFAADGPGTANFGGDELVNEDGNGDLVMARYAGATGEHLWSASLATDAFSGINDLVVTGTGRIIAVGFFTGSMDFGGGPLGEAEGTSAFVAMFRLINGEYRWAMSFGEGANTSVARAAAYSALHTLFVGGSFAGQLRFGIWPLASDGGESDAFLLRVE